jgi:hypothetical protein
MVCVLPGFHSTIRNRVCAPGLPFDDPESSCRIMTRGVSLARWTQRAEFAHEIWSRLLTCIPTRCVLRTPLRLSIGEASDETDERL